MSTTRLRIRIAATITAVLGLVVIGQAAAGIRPDDRSGLRGNGVSSQVVYPDAVDRYIASHSADVLRPDDRSGTRGGGLSAQIPPPVTQPGESFDWGDAGLGASMTVALLLGLGAVLGTARRWRSRSAAA
jgi:hypothetical protein